MNLLASILVGVLFGTSIHLMLKRNKLEGLLGFALLSNAVNLAILVGSGWFADKRPPILNDEYEKVTTDSGEQYVSTVIASDYVDPIPHALVLTAIVIGFALVSFLMILAAEYIKREKEEDGEASQ